MIFRRERWLCELLQVLEVNSKRILGISGRGLHPDPLSSKRFSTFLCFASTIDSQRHFLGIQICLLEAERLCHSQFTCGKGQHP